MFSRRFVSGDEQAETLFDDLVKYAETSIDHRFALGGNAPVSIMKNGESMINIKVKDFNSPFHVFPV